MKSKPLILLILLVTLPLGFLGFLGVRVALQDRAAQKQLHRDLLESKLRDTDELIQRYLEEQERALLDATQFTVLDTASLRQAATSFGLIRNIFVLDPEGRLAFPPIDAPRSAAEESFLTRTQPIWESKDIYYAAKQGLSPDVYNSFVMQSAADQGYNYAPQQSLQDTPPPQTSTNIQGAPQVDSVQQAQPTSRMALPSLNKLRAQQQDNRSSTTKSDLPEGNRGNITTHEPFGWYVWYVNRGLDLIFWQRDKRGWIIGAELDRTRLMADVIGVLPDSARGDPLLENGAIALYDGRGQRICQWGATGHVPSPKSTSINEPPLAALPLSAPLQSWHLRYYGDGHRNQTLLQSMLPTLLSLAAFAIALCGLAIFFYREHTRQLRQATQRVSFVNRVSHELRTPLTNIRMYAELLQRRLDDTDENTSRQLTVILAESERLSRLIANVLSFAHAQRGKLQIKPRACVADDTVRATLDAFRPSLENKRFIVETDLQAAKTVHIDEDALEQILNNLIGNAEKYAAAGGWLRVCSSISDMTLRIEVLDHGPGIAPRLRNEIFQPFVRVHDTLTEGVSGAGIGLSIARELCRMHGGDLILQPTEQGAHFIATISISTGNDHNESSNRRR